MDISSNQTGQPAEVKLKRLLAVCFILVLVDQIVLDAKMEMVRAACRWYRAVRASEKIWIGR